MVEIEGTGFGRYLEGTVVSSEGISQFQALIYDYYKAHRRVLAWRYCDNPYYVIVSEIMLQQTQVDRVINKYEQFIAAFPTLEQLANARISDVIAVWQGLGYNRRALSLQLLARRVYEEYGGEIPQDPELLTTFKGIGKATAASICAFAFNSPTIFIETNIRSVYIHCFFSGASEVKDNDILPVVEQTVDLNDPRSWYYALMDYGVMLKKKHKNPSRKSAHYVVQSRFEGSDRQVRGLILKLLLERQIMAEDEFFACIERDPERISLILAALCKEGFIVENKGFYRLVS
ncbi:A/G-specific adenine glycosylase [Candidatus Dependentiae bacterium]|nr:A/G-specific adenine glycosylase [Candidatus Dependentiae bacterium]